MGTKWFKCIGCDCVADWELQLAATAQRQEGGLDHIIANLGKDPHSAF